MKETAIILTMLAAIVLLTGNAGEAQPRFDCLIGVQSACDAIGETTVSHPQSEEK